MNINYKQKISIIINVLKHTIGATLEAFGVEGLRFFVAFDVDACGLLECLTVEFV